MRTKNIVLPGLMPQQSFKDMTPAMRLQFGQSLGAAGLFAGAQQVLEPIIDDAECGPSARQELVINRYVQRSGFLDEFQQLANPDYDQSSTLAKLGLAPGPETRFFMVDGLVWRKPKHGRTLFFFTGTALRNLPRIALLHQLFKTLDCNIVYVRDHQKLWHMGGLAGMPSTEPVAMALELARLHAALGGGDIFMAGTSVGGYAALRFGLNMGAQAVLGLSAFTDINLPVAERADYPALHMLYQTMPELAEDLLPAYAEAAQPPRVILAYGDAHERDARHAQHFGTIPDCTLVPVAGLDSHDTLKHFLATGQLKTLMQQLLGAKSEAPMATRPA